MSFSRSSSVSSVGSTGVEDYPAKKLKNDEGLVEKVSHIYCENTENITPPVNNTWKNPLRKKMVKAILERDFATLVHLLNNNIKIPEPYWAFVMEMAVRTQNLDFVKLICQSVILTKSEQASAINVADKIGNVIIGHELRNYNFACPAYYETHFHSIASGIDDYPSPDCSIDIGNVEK